MGQRGTSRDMGTRSRALTALAAAALALLSSCSSTQWQRFKANAASHTASASVAALSSFVAWPLGAAVFVAGVVGGMGVQAAMEPPPEVEERTTIVQVGQPNVDGTPSKPRVDVYYHKTLKEAPDRPGFPGIGTLPTPEGFWDRVWRAMQVVWWVLLACAASVWALTHPRAIGFAWNLARCGGSIAWHSVTYSWSLISAPITKRPKDTNTNAIADPDPESRP